MYIQIISTDLKGLIDMHDLTNEQLLQKINEIQEKHKLKRFVFPQYIRLHYQDLYLEILKRTKFLDEKCSSGKMVSLFERIYCLKNNITSIQLCKQCGKKQVKFYSHLDRYADYCCVICGSSSKDAQEKAKATKIEKYGEDYNYVIAKKAKQTRYEKYDGKYNPKDFSSKVKATKLKHYGDENYTNYEKSKQTRISRYGSASYNNHEKISQTKLEKYGDANWNNRKQFKETLSKRTEQQKEATKEKRKQTNLKEYGHEFATQSKKTKQKMQDTCLKKYGVKNTFNTDKSNKNRRAAHKLKSWQFIIDNSSECSPLFTKEEFINRDENDKLKWHCNKCGNNFEAPYPFTMQRLCENCYPRIKMGISKEEQDVVVYLKNICGEDKVINQEQFNRQLLGNNKELDIIVPDAKIAIEYDGLYWHSDIGKKAHLEKTEICESKGWQLIHIFEDEWLDKQKIVKSRLKHLVLKNGRKIFARKCVVKEIDVKTKNAFLNKYHLQGTAMSKVNLGLYYRNHLVAVMTFVKPRYTKQYQYELQRYATVFNFTVVGGASKLLKYFERNYNPKSIISYADRRWSTGNLYKQIGFQLDHTSRPSYFYVKYGHRFSRIMFQKHKLSKLLDKFDPALSETQNMAINGYSQIFDCGNLVFVKKYT